VLPSTNGNGVLSVAAPAEMPTAAVLKVSLISSAAGSVELDPALMECAAAEYEFRLGECMFTLRPEGPSAGGLHAIWCQAAGPRLTELAFAEPFTGTLLLPPNLLPPGTLLVADSGPIGVSRPPLGAQTAVRLEAAARVELKEAFEVFCDPGQALLTGSPTYARTGLMAEGDVFWAPAAVAVLGAVGQDDGSYVVDASFSGVIVTETPLSAPGPVTAGQYRIVLPACGSYLVEGPSAVVAGSIAVLTVLTADGLLVPGADLNVNGQIYTADACGRIVLPAVWADCVVTLSPCLSGAPAQV